MLASDIKLPDRQTLMLGLASIFRSNGYSSSQPTIIDREPHIYTSTYPSEIVTCQLDDGVELRLLCKYSGGRTTTLWHTGGIDYEAKIYRHVLQPFEGSAPKFYGVYRDPTTGWTWLVLEYLDNCLWVSKIPDLLSRAARWIGQFHAASEARCQCASMSWLHTYDAEYYLEWPQRTMRFADSLNELFPWLATFCESLKDFVDALLASPATVIHGEFYPSNILVRDGVIYPVDWESAAIAAGEIDIAALTENWGADVIEECELEYQRTRWPEGPPVDFRLTLDVARSYWHLRYLGCSSHLKMSKGNKRRLEQLRVVAERWGLI